MNINYSKELSRPEKLEADKWINEALFGYNHVEGHIKKLKQDANVLEVGCGSGILLSMFSNHFKKIYFQGIEPFGAGFASLAKLNQTIKKQGVNIFNIGFEEFKPKKKYDLIYCVNVFEHFSDWRLFIKTAHLWLKDSGSLIILCPNYGFPYESHFGLPIIFNKKITYMLFKNYIDQYELDNNSKGLWNSLNFVTKKKLVSFVKRKSFFLLNDDMSIMDDMVDRLSHDIQFRKRHKILGYAAIFLKKIGFFILLTLVPNLIPYMKIVLIKRN
jgi:2-polyprenyl-3-methyl-5-hydroxy-6-metoxy-1,4-benzoquinol methylase